MPPARPRARRLAVWAVVFLCVAGGLFVFRGPLLVGLAKAWIVDEAPAKSDAIVLLAGATPNVVFEAVRLHREGFASRIVLMKGRLRPTDRMKLTQPGHEFARELLIQRGVAPADISFAGDDLTTSYEEMGALRDWARSTGVSRLLVLAEVFHTRRVKWCARQLAQPAGCDVRVAAVPTPECNSGNWYRKERGLIAFENEAVLCAFYRLKY